MVVVRGGFRGGGFRGDVRGGGVRGVVRGGARGTALVRFGLACANAIVSWA